MGFNSGFKGLKVGTSKENCEISVLPYYWNQKTCPAFPASPASYYTASVWQRCSRPKVMMEDIHRPWSTADVTRGQHVAITACGLSLIWLERCVLKHLSYVTKFVEVFLARTAW